MKSLITAAAVVALTGAVVPWSLSAQHTSSAYQPPETSTSVEIVAAPPVETTTTEKVEVKKIRPQVTVIKTKRHTTTAETVSPATVDSGTTASTTAMPVAIETAEPAPAPAPAPAPTIVYVPAPAPEPVATAGEAPAPMPEPPKKLPKTASPLPLMLLSAVGAFSGAGVMRVLRRRQS